MVSWMLLKALDREHSVEVGPSFVGAEVAVEMLCPGSVSSTACHRVISQGQMEHDKGIESQPRRWQELV